MTKESKNREDNRLGRTMGRDSVGAEARIVEAIEQAQAGVGAVSDIVRAMLEAELVRQATTDQDPPGYDRVRVRTIIEAELDRMDALASVMAEKIGEAKAVVEQTVDPGVNVTGEVQQDGVNLVGGVEVAETLEPQVQEISAELAQEISQAVESGSVEVKEQDPVLVERDRKEREHADKVMKSLRIPDNGQLDKIDYQGLLDSLAGYTYAKDAYNTYGELRRADTLEAALYALMKLNERGNYDEVMAKLLDAYIAIPMGSWDKQRTYGYWSHSLCHLYETYGRGEDYQSLLMEKGLVDANARAINEAGRRMAEVRYLGCMPRIVLPLMRWNLDQADAGNLDVPIALKPEVLMDENYVKYLEAELTNSAEGRDIRQMLILSRAATVRELLVELVKEGIKSDRNYLHLEISRNMPRLLRILEALRPAITIDELNIYMGKAIHSQMGRDTGIAKIGYDALKANVETAEQASELCPGLYTDVDGTLLMHNGKEGLSLNEGVLNAMKEAREMGLKVTIVTGGDPELKAEQLLELGLPKTYLPVKSKYDYRGKVLEVLIDDTAPDIQGLKVGSHHNGHIYHGQMLRLVREGEVLVLKEERVEK